MKKTESRPIDDAVVLDWLVEKCNANYAVEVGTFVGLTASIINRFGLETVCYDIWRPLPGSTDPINEIYLRHENVYDICCKNLQTQIEDGEILLVPVAKGTHWYDDVKTAADFIFLDADHRYEAIFDDIVHALDRIKNGGILCGHDYGTFEGVTRAVDELLPDAKKRGTMWWVEL